jgi:hypothetical protein
LERKEGDEDAILLRMIDAGLGKWASDKSVMFSHEKQEENIKFGSLEENF